ncbi:MAG: universal stress protein [Nitrospirae bacterium YQR-1]
MECIGDKERLLHFAGRRRILIAVDESISSKRAVSFICEMFRGVSGFTFILYNLVNLFDDDDFVCDLECNEFIKSAVKEKTKILEEYKSMLMESGIREEDIITKSEIRSEPTVAECILKEQRSAQCSAIVTGRRGISKREEFLMGSTSNRLVHLAKDCAVWVIE